MAGAQKLHGFRIKARIRRDGQTYSRKGQAGIAVWKHYKGDARAYRAAYIANCTASNEEVLQLSVRTITFK